MNYRIVILGDPHIGAAEEPLWRNEVVPDINRLKPDRVVVMGDLTGSPDVGSRASTARAVEILNGIQAPWASIIGNHDLQAKEFSTDEEAVAMMLEALGRKRTGFTIEEEAFAIIGLDNTAWRRNPVNKNEIVVEDAQIAWWEAELTRLEGKPVIVICHAPPIGSGVLTVAEHHVRVGNAYANQSAVPGRLQEVVWKHPNILFWFSAHNHLGQHYRDAIHQQLGLFYVHTGTASRKSSRDGYRHSRILEIGTHGIRIRTFDHGLRAIDEELDFDWPEPLHQMMEARRRFLGMRYVPRDPVTMAHPAPSAVRGHHTRRYLFLSDAHSAAPLAPVQARVAEWCGRLARSVMPDAVILGGDISSVPNPEQAEAFLNAFGFREPELVYLPGNYEGEDFCFPASVKGITGCVRLEDRVFALSTASRADAEASVTSLLGQLPTGGSVLVFAHFPPMMLGEELQQRLQTAPCRIEWIAGHRHQASETETGQLHLQIGGGLDPVKVKDSLPEVLVIDWDGSTALVKRVSVERKVITAFCKPQHFVGVAYRAGTEDLLRRGIARKVPALQFHYKHSFGEPSADARTLAWEYRQKGGFLSLHLPNFPHPQEGVTLHELEQWLIFAEALSLDDLTIHLPDVSCETLYQPDGAFQETTWARECLEALTALSKRALQMKAQISFENVYNKKVLPPGQERLGTKPWHFQKLIPELQNRLRREGFTGDEVKRVGMILDNGHAFTDAFVSKQHGLADWLVQVAPFLQLLHIHQVVNTEDGRKNHRPIRELHGPLINYYGFLAALGDFTEKALPLLVEVREEAGAFESLCTLAGSGLVAEWEGGGQRMPAAGIV